MPRTHSRDQDRDANPTVRLWRAGALCVATLGASVALLSACGSSNNAVTGSANSTPSAMSSIDMSSMSSTGSSMTSPSQSGLTSPIAGMATSGVTIHISSFSYTTPTSVSPGATVTVMNMDGENHTVTADTGNAFDVKADADKTVTFKAPTKPGSYPFHCSYHSNMHGVLVVK
ncbi:MAG: copper ion binding protein [Frankiales bacterium]|nr:copper ion binding protein [Frankiales bacterium]